MKIKLISLSVLLATLSACASIATNSSESLHLMDGSSLIIENGKVVNIIDKTGTTADVQKGKMEELADGRFIYIRRDGTVNKMGESKSSHGAGSKNSNSGHSH